MSDESRDNMSVCLAPGASLSLNEFQWVGSARLGPRRPRSFRLGYSGDGGRERVRRSRDGRPLPTSTSGPDPPRFSKGPAFLETQGGWGRTVPEQYIFSGSRKVYAPGPQTFPKLTPTFPSRRRIKSIII